MSDTPAPAAVWQPKANPWLIAVAVMSATFMEVLDTSVANVSLPHIAGSLSATTDESTWVLTSYLVSNAVVLPATGWCARFFGRRRFLISCIVLFTAASVLCGMASSLGFLILARTLQGVGGGALQPISQAILLESFPPQKRGQAMAVFAMGVIVAPVLGPTLGGWITDNYTWRWIFYINVPFGVLAVTLCSMFIEDPPYLRNARRSAIDYTGLSLLALWIGALQVMLDRGQDEDWFSSRLICALAVIAAVGFVAFVFWELTVEDPLVHLRILADRNYATGVLLMAVLGGVLYGTTASLPLFLQNLLGYPALQSGLVLSPRGIAAICMTIVAGRFFGKIDSRAFLVFGFCVLSYSSFALSRISLGTSMATVMIPTIINGIGISGIFVPLTTTTMSTVPAEMMGDATGIFNLLRNLGGGVGISVVTALITRGAQTHQAMLAAHLTPYDRPLTEHLAAAGAALAPQSGGPAAAAQALGSVYHSLQAQSATMAYVDQFQLFGFLCLLCMPFIFFLKGARAKPGLAAAH